jgi:hypothetical protein
MGIDAVLLKSYSTFFHTPFNWNHSMNQVFNPCVAFYSKWVLPLEQYDLSVSMLFVCRQLMWSLCIPSAHCWCLCCLSHFAHSCCSSISQSRTPHSSLRNIPNVVGPCFLSWWMLVCGVEEETTIRPKPRRSDIFVIAPCVTGIENGNESLRKLNGVVGWK